MWSGLTLPIHFPQEHCHVPKLRQGSISIWHFNWSTLCHNIFQLPQERQLLEEKEKRVFSSTIYHYNRKKVFETQNYDVIFGYKFKFLCNRYEYTTVKVCIEYHIITVITEIILFGNLLETNSMIPQITVTFPVHFIRTREKKWNSQQKKSNLLKVKISNVYVQPCQNTK